MIARLLACFFSFVCFQTARADSTVVFSEVMYHPSTNEAASEWVELHSLMSVDMDLSGWSLRGGVEFTFPQDTILSGGSYLIIASSPEAFATSHGVTNVLGPFIGRLSNSGERLELRDANDRVMDSLDYRVGGKWPVTPDGSGASLAKRGPLLATDSPESWMGSPQRGGTPGALNFPKPAPTTNSLLVLSRNARWNFDETGADLGSGWRSQMFNDSGWNVGNGPFHLGEMSGTATALRPGPIIYYFRKSFVVPEDWANASLTLAASIDDGAVVYLNGIEATRWNMPTGTINFQTLASGAIEQASFQTLLTLPSGALAAGTNFIAVEVHQAQIAPSYPLAVLNSSPIAFWRFGTRGGADAATDSGEPQRGPQNGAFQNLNAANLSEAGPRSSDVIGGNSLQGFEADNQGPRYAGNGDAGDDVFLVPDTGAFNFTARRAFTLEAWVKGAASQESGAAIFAKGIGGGGEQFTLDVSGGVYRFFVRDSSGAATVTSSSVAPNGAWQHLVAVFHQSAGLMRLYVNGVLAASTAPPATLLNHLHEVSIGARKLNSASGYNLNFDGVIDEAAIYDRALSTNEIAAHFAAAFASNPQGGADTNDAAFDLELELRTIEPPANSPTLVFNEVSAGANGGWFELHNSSPNPVDLSGAILLLKGLTDGEFTFSSLIIPSGGFAHFTTNDIGFPFEVGAKLFLLSADRERIFDGVILKNGVRARYPDGAPEWFTTGQPTPGNSNEVALSHNIVINEIFYHDRATTNQVEGAGTFVELLNLNSNAVSLAGWRLDGGIEFAFASNQVIAPGGFLVIAKNPTHLQSLHPAATITGPFVGKLSKSEDAIELIDASGNRADFVRYFDEGRWPEEADGGAASLELKDPRSDNEIAESWGASHEAFKATWQTYRYRGVAQTPLPGLPDHWHELIFGVLDGAGEVLLDDISVVENPDGARVEFLQNGSFANGSSAHWRFLGNHKRSGVEPDGDLPGNFVLRVVSSGPTEYQGNQIETTFLPGRSVVDGRTYEISFRAKWISGKSLLQSRLYFNRLARTTPLGLPATTGTPGAANSSQVLNAGPVYESLTHAPVVPEPTELVKVSIAARDPDGIAEMRLWSSIGGGGWTAVPMSERADRFEATLPARPAGTLTQFYVQGIDTRGVSSFFPKAGWASRAFYRVNDGAAVSSPHTFRVLMHPSDAALLHAPTNVLSNELLGGTVIYDESETFYDVGVRLKGSFVGRDVPRVGFTVVFDPAQKFRGVHGKVSIDRSQHTSVGQAEIIAKHIATRAGGIPNMYDDLIHLLAPRSSENSRAQLRMAGFDDVYLDSQFKNGSDGSMFEFEVIRYSTRTHDGTPEGHKLPGGGYVNLDLADYGENKETYRWLLLKSNQRTEDDYSTIIEMAKSLSLTGAALDAASQRWLDVNQWLRTFAYQSLLGVGDAYFTGANRHNIRLYVRPEDDRVLAMPWDWDSSFQKPADASLVGVDNFAKVVSLPNNLHAYQAHLHDIIERSFNTEDMARWTSHYGALAGQNFSGILAYIGNRAAYVLSQLPSGAAFAITNNNGQNFSVSTNRVRLGGTASSRVHSIQFNDTAYAVSWNELGNWSATIPLRGGPNAIRVQGYDASGVPLADAIDSISIFNSGTEPLRGIVINEWMADNKGPGGIADPADGLFKDWLELFNPNTSAVDVSGFFLSDDLANPMKWRLPTATLIPARGFLLIWADGKTNLNNAGSADLHASFSLSKDGESLGLFGTNGLTAESIVQFGPQKENLSQGLFADGVTNRFYFMPIPTPKSPNQLPTLKLMSVAEQNGMVAFHLSAIPEETYQLQFRTNLVAGVWLDLGFPVRATSSELRLDAPIGPEPSGFYRVRRAE